MEEVVEVAILVSRDRQEDVRKTPQGLLVLFSGRVQLGVATVQVGRAEGFFLQYAAGWLAGGNLLCFMGLAQWLQLVDSSLTQAPEWLALITKRGNNRSEN